MRAANNKLLERLRGISSDSFCCANPSVVGLPTNDDDSLVQWTLEKVNPFGFFINNKDIDLRKQDLKVEQ